MLVRGELSEAVRDLRYLLGHGYPRESAVNFVSNHYRLPLHQRHLLARCVFSEAEASRHRSKLVSREMVRGKSLGVDGYNVLITVESILMGREVVLCDDGFIRDLRAMFGKYRRSATTPKAIEEIIRVIGKAMPKGVFMFFDKQVSKSGELAAEVRRKLEQAGLGGGAIAVGGVDMRLRAFDVVASSDRAIIERAKAVWDIPADVRKGKRANLLRLQSKNRKAFQNMGENRRCSN